MNNVTSHHKDNQPGRRACRFYNKFDVAYCELYHGRSQARAEKGGGLGNVLAAHPHKNLLLLQKQLILKKHCRKNKAHPQSLSRTWT